MIEIGAVKLNRYGEELGSFNQFVRPRINEQLSAFCMELTGIEQAQISRAERFPKVIQHFMDWAEIYEEEYVLVAWGREDRMLLQNDCMLHDLEYDWLEPYLNLKRAYKQLKKLNKPYGLQKSLTKEGFEFDGQPHRAIDDAINTVKIFRRYLDEWGF